MPQDSKSSIAKAAALFFSGTLLSRITGMLRDISMAAAFGTNASVAAFFVAFRLAHLFRRLLGEGALQSAFIPHFEELKKQSEEKALAFFSSLALALTLLLSLGIGATCLTCRHLTGEVAHLTLLMLPSLLFICLFGLNASLLQCKGHFFTTSVAPVAFNLIWIGGVFLTRRLNPALAMEKMAYVLIVGCLCQWLMTLPQVLKKLPSLTFDYKPLKKLLPALGIAMLGVSAAQINNAVDALFARYAENAGPAYLWYAIRIQQLPLSLFGVALSGALLPPLSRATPEQFSSFLSFSLKATTAILLPITLIYCYFGKTLVSLLYQRGDFLEASVLGTTNCLFAYSLGLLPMALILLLAPALYAQKDYKTPASASALALGLNISLNSLFIFGLGWGAVSVAYATSISAWVNLALLTTKVRERLTSFNMCVQESRKFPAD